jgi:hypothetical protein
VAAQRQDGAVARAGKLDVDLGLARSSTSRMPRIT